MRTKTYEFGVDIGPVYVTALVEYNVWPAEPMVMYDSNGTGHPGSPPELEILNVVVTSVSGETYDNTELGDWGKDLDRIVGEYVDGSEWLQEDLFENASD